MKMTGPEPTPRQISVKPPDAGSLFFEDTRGFKSPVKTGMASPRVSRSFSPAPSSSSEEDIVFNGRSGAKSPIGKRKRVFDTSDEARVPAKPTQVLEDPLQCQERTPDLSVSRETNKIHTSTTPKRRDLSERKLGHCEQEDLPMEDYISNLKLNGLLTIESDSASSRGCHLASSGIVRKGESRSSRLEAQCRAGKCADPENFDKLKSPSGEAESTGKESAKLELSSSPQNSVAAGSTSSTNTQWVSSHIWTASREEHDLRRKLNHQRSPEHGHVECDDPSHVDEFDRQEAEFPPEPKTNRPRGREIRMTDEQTATLLSKQEELGMCSNDAGLSLDSDVSSRKKASPTRMSDFVPLGSAQSHPLPSFDDSYGDFDVMDFERPSIRRKPKGRRAKVEFDVSDSEIQHALQTAWKNDRIKKKAQKQERLELRLKGLLGMMIELRDSLMAKYANGFSVDQIGSEVRTFLDSSNENLCLPPMDPHARKVVHEIGHRHGLKSKSMGAGNARFPILYKTSRTRKFDDRLFAQIRRRFMPNPAKGKTKITNGVRKRGNTGPGAVYRDGEIVGAFAPELGQENKGRAMLE